MSGPAPKEAKPIAKVLYITCSSYSGSTLLSFLLNAHPRICTIGHTTGWAFGPDEVFRCSCGAPIQSCPFYNHLEQSYRDSGLAFDYRDFGTGYKLAANERLNRYLTTRLPHLQSSALETMRDDALRRLPGIGRRLAAIERANLCLIEASLAYFGAAVFVDNSHSAYRLRALKRIQDLDVAALHLVRDFRGVAYSNMRLREVDAAGAAGLWLDEQSDICRVAGGAGPLERLTYEALCDATDDSLAGIHGLVGLPFAPFNGDFKAAEHHILGNEMRLGSSKIVKNAKWRRELSSADRKTIEATALGFAERHPGHPVAELVHHYLDAPEA